MDQLRHEPYELLGISLEVSTFRIIYPDWVVEIIDSLTDEEYNRLIDTVRAGFTEEIEKLAKKEKKNV